MHALSPRTASLRTHLSPGTASAPASTPAARPPSAATTPPDGNLSPGTASRATPAERDLAYELGVEAEAAGDHVRAAAAHERAYRLTAPAETGPRLLFLRASVAARLRADDGAPDTRAQLCHAQQLLRDYLGDAPPQATDERATLEQIDLRLRQPGTDCATLLGLTPPPPAPTAPPEPPPLTSPEPAAPPQVTTPAPARPPLAARALRISGVVGFGVGLTGVALLAGGVVMGRRANERGELLCHLLQAGCNAFDPELRDIAATGRRGDALIRAGVVMAAVGVLAGVVLLAVGQRLHRRSRAALTPTLAPGLALSGRF